MKDLGVELIYEILKYVCNDRNITNYCNNIKKI